MRHLLRLLLCLPLLHACGKQPASDDYFPLGKGLRWDYQVMIEQPQHSERKALTIENLGEETLQDTAASVRRTSDGTDYYIVRKDDGLYRIAKRSIVELAPQVDKPPRMVLPLPLAQAQGKTWSSISMPYLIMRVYEGENSTYAKDLRFPMTYTVKSLDETVDVPAGNFAHCVLVEGQTEVRLYTDPRKGETPIQITTREWYAPGVGLVKLERDEPLNTDVYKGGKLTLQLEHFTD